MKSPVFARVRSHAVAAVLLAAGSSALVACSSDDAQRPSPNYTRPVSRTPVAPPPYSPPPTYAAPTYTAPTYVAPTQPTYTPPPTTVPAPKPGQMACGKGKCG